jgi:homoserine dehydrogenase
VTSPEHRPPTFRIGVLGHGTVGRAVTELVAERAGHIESITGMCPEVTGILTTRSGSFEEVLDGADLVVEVMGGLDPARDYVLRAMAAGRHVVTANKMLLAHHGEELWAAAREHEVQLRFEAAVAGVVPVIRVLQESLAGAHVERLHGIVNGTTNFILSQMAETGASYPDALAEAQRLGYAEADPTQDVNGEDAARRWRSSRGWPSTRPCGSTRSSTRASSGSPRRTWTTPRSSGSGSSSSGRPSACRSPADGDGGAAAPAGRPRAQRPRAPAFLYAGHPLASVSGPFNAVTIESPAITEVTLSGPGAGGPQTASAILGDVISAMIPPASTPETTQRLPLVRDVESAFYLHLEVADRPGVLAQVAQLLGLQGASVKSVVQKGLGGNARLVMVVHPLLESRFFAAVELIGGLDFLRSRPRAIRVIEEEYA